MGTDKNTPLYISNDLYLKLPKEEQDKFELFARYKDDPKDDDWEDENRIFWGVDDLMEFWGTEYCSNATGSVYKKLISEEEVEEWESDKTKDSTKSNGCWCQCHQIYKS